MLAADGQREETAARQEMNSSPPFQSRPFHLEEGAMLTGLIIPLFQNTTSLLLMPYIAFHHLFSFAKHRYFL